MGRQALPGAFLGLKMGAGSVHYLNIILSSELFSIILA